MEILEMIDAAFWKNKRVLITGHSGFKGSWLTFWLRDLGAKICGISLEPSSQPNLFSALNLEREIENHFCDIRDRARLSKIVKAFSPEIVFHMAAQPLVRESYRHPLETYETNVIGTGNLLNTLRECESVKSIVVVTTDKCYENIERDVAYRETDPLGGHDPYSSSKACTEILTASFRKSFFAPEVLKRPVGLATARAGNAIGGGDFSEDRIIPDVFRNLFSGASLAIRNPAATRPWQHVLVPLSGYILLAQKLWTEPLKFSEAFNFAPADADCVPVKQLLGQLEQKFGESLKWIDESADSQKLHEARFLKLDASKARTQLGWYPVWNLDQTLTATAEWYHSFRYNPSAIVQITRRQISEVSRL